METKKPTVIFCDYSQTFRLMPFNYWLASAKDKKLLFNSWDGMAKEHFKKDKFLKLKIWFKFFTLKYNK